MKKIIYFLFVAIVLSACGGVQKSGPVYTLNLVKSTDFLTAVDTTKLPNISTIKIQGKCLTMVIDGQEKDFSIYSSMCYEGVYPNASSYYTWKFNIIASDYKCVFVHKYMDEFLSPDPNLCDYVSIEPYDKESEFYLYDIKGGVDIPRHYVDAYDATKLPKLEFTNMSFDLDDDCNPNNVPSVISSAKSMVIEGSTVKISDGSQTTTLHIYDCSDKEYIDDEYYSYCFYTMATKDCPKMNFDLSITTKRNCVVILVDNCDVNEGVGGFRVDKDDFKSWNNLKPGICVCSPLEEDYKAWENKQQ